ncbi:Alpha beta hydrolase [Olea europaea subsp. europaea]|uniref:Alpha beta hydrolase n=1 Tax=Olea europaea subsp. europaea TaxID=158383 RepID=A0A8S0R0M8_OLEEU|nr:Alpha beta hydrolase [Olea europaea subsp. europaea]
MYRHDGVRILYSRDAKLQAHVSQRSNLKLVKTVIDHFDEQQLENFCNSSLGYLAEVLDIHFSAQLIQQLVFKIVRTDKLYELWFNVQGHLTRFGLQEYVLVTGLRCGAFLEGAEYERFLERRRLKESHGGGLAEREDSNEEASEGGSSDEQTSEGDEEKGVSGSNPNGEDTGESDGDRFRTDKDTVEEIGVPLPHLATLVARAGPTTAVTATGTETKVGVSGSLPEDVYEELAEPCLDEQDIPIDTGNMQAHIAPCQTMSTCQWPLQVKKCKMQEPWSPRMRPGTTMMRRRVAMRRMAMVLLLKSQLPGRYQKHESSYNETALGTIATIDFCYQDSIYGREGEENQEAGSDVGRTEIEGDILKLVGIFALLWGDRRGSMSSTDKLISFMRIAKRPLILRILGFVFMVLLLWSPVVIPLLPSLIQIWATRRPFTELLSLLALLCLRLYHDNDYFMGGKNSQV